MSSLQVHKSGFLKTQSGVKRIEMQDLRIFPLTLTSKGMGSMTARSQVISHTDSEENPDLGALRSSSAFFHFVRAEPGSSAAGLSYVIHRTSRAQISPITSHFFCGSLIFANAQPRSTFSHVSISPSFFPCM